MAKYETKQSLFVIKENTSKAINHIIAKDLISPPLELKAVWDKSFRNSLRINSIVPTYSLIGLGVSFFCVVIAIIVLVVVVPVPFWVYIIYAFAGLAIILASGVLGYLIKNERKTISNRKLVNFIMQSILEWTKNQLKNERDLNNRRLIIENLLHAYFTYLHHPKVDNLRLPRLSDEVQAIIDDEESRTAIKVAIRLFEIIFSDEKTIFDESGIMYITKILSPLLKLTTDPKLAEHINKLFKKFLVDTKINIAQTKYSVTKVGTSSKVRVSVRQLKEEKLMLPFFDDLWKIPTEILSRKSQNNLLEFVVNSQDPFKSKSDYVEDHIANAITSFKEIYKLQNENQHDNLGHSIAQLETNAILSNHDSPLLNKPQDGRHKTDHQANQNDLWISSELEQYKNSFVSPNFSDQRLKIKRTLTIIKNDKDVQVSYHQPQNSEEIIEQINIKKISITPQELDPIVDKILSIHTAPAAEFSLLAEAPRIRVYKNKEEKPAMLIKSNFEINLPASRVFKLIYDLDYRSQWDKNLSKFKIVKIINESTDLMYCYFKAPPLVSDRDYLQKRVLVKNWQDAEYVIAFESIDDPEFPPTKGVIRAHTFISGYIIFSTGPNTCNLTSVSQTDFKGTIPKAVLNQAVQKGPIEWLSKIEAASLTINESF